MSGRCNERVARRLARFGSGWIPWGDDAANLLDSVPRMRDAVDRAGGDARAMAVLGTFRLPRTSDHTIDLGATTDGLSQLAEVGVGDVLIHLKAPGSYDEALDAYANVVGAVKEATGR